MSEGPDDSAGPAQAGPDSPGLYSVDARGGAGIQVGEGNTQVNNYVYKVRRSLIGLATLLVIGLVLLPTDTHIAAGVLPAVWKPFLWLAWPAEILLAGALVYGEVRDRRERRLLPGDVGEQRAQLARARDDLAGAVRSQWTAEAGVRLLHSPEPVRVPWRSVGRPAGADISRVLAADAIPGRLTEVRGDIRHVLEVFRSVRARQLVILGEPAAGKSVMALSLTLGLLPEQSSGLVPGEPVPVLVTASSWNPRKEGLHGWLARRIEEEYPALANADAYGPGAAMRLIAGKYVVPVLDGLDEMPEALQPAAISAIDQAVSAGRYPLVVTCRTAEYRAAVRANGRLLAHAAVLEIRPLSIDDAAEFLLGADALPERWRSMLDGVRGDPGGPLGQTLRSPLMADLARTAYATADSEPAELLDTARFPGQADVERHLLGAFLRAAYRERPAGHGPEPGPALQPYPAERAGRWLRFLASTLNAPGAPIPAAPGTDLAWWQLLYAERRSTRAVLAGLVTGLVAGLAMGFSLGPIAGLAYALTFGPAAGFTYGYARLRRPSRIQVRFRGHGRSLLRRLAAGLAVGLATGHPATGAVVLAVLVAQLWWTDTSPDTATASTPVDVLRQDRRAALVLGGALSLAVSPAAAAGFMAGTADFPVALGGGTAAVVTAVCSGAVISAVIGAILGGVLIGRAGAVAFGAASAAVSVPVAISVPVLGTSYDKIIPPHPGLAAGISFGILLGWMAVMSRSWGAFAPVRAWTALRGDLPLHLMRFLDDAHKRGVLRQAGTVYQFRHTLLRDHLAVPASHMPHETSVGVAPQPSASRTVKR